MSAGIPPGLQVNVLRQPEDAGRFWEWLTHRPQGYVACDVETGSNPIGHETEWSQPGFHVRMMQFGDTEGGWAIPMQGWPALVDAAFKWTSENRIKTVWWNGFTFDTQALQVAHGITVDPIHIQDMMVYSRLRGFGDELHGLKDQGVKELGQWVGIGETVLGRAMKINKWTWSNIPFGFKPYPLYGVVDVIATAMLYERWEADRHRWASHHDLEIAVAVATNEMARRGAAVDGGYLHKHAMAFREQENQLLAEADAMGWGDIKVKQNVTQILQNAGALDLNRLTDTGQLSLDREQLINADHPLAKLILKHRKLELIRTRYLEKIWELAGSQDGIGVVHPSIWSMQAKTSRMSVSNPPLQQLPADEEFGPLVRNGFVPRTPDEILVGADFGQIEMRLWASLNKDPELLKVFAEADATGGDFFVIMARQLFNEPGFAKADPRRKIIKNASYATIFTGGDDRIAQTANLPLEQVTPVVAQLRQRYKSFADVGRSLLKYEGRTAYVETPTGRRFRAWNKNNFRVLPNWGDQGHAAEIIKEAIVRMRAAGLGEYMLLPVHDEQLMSVPRRIARDVSMEMEEIMGGVVDPEEYGVPIKASSYIAERWGEADK